MEEEGFTVQVKGVTRKEFLQANHLLKLRVYIALPILLAFMAISILLINGTGEWGTLWVIAGITLVVILGYHFYYCYAYKKYPYNEMEMTYRFDSLGWRLEANGGTGVVAWANTEKIRTTKEVLLLYAKGGSKRKQVSNVVPRRCLEEGQAEQIMAWFKAKRIR